MTRKLTLTAAALLTAFTLTACGGSADPGDTALDTSENTARSNDGTLDDDEYAAVLKSSGASADAVEMMRLTGHTQLSSLGAAVCQGLGSGLGWTDVVTLLAGNTDSLSLNDWSAVAMGGAYPQCADLVTEAVAAEA